VISHEADFRYPPGQREHTLGLSTSLVVFAVGAILRFAVTVHSSGFNIHTIGVILMVVGAVGFVLSAIFWASWGGFNTGGASRSRRSVYRQADGSVVEEQQTNQF